MTSMTKQLVLQALGNLCGDDLERANHAFGRMSNTELDKQWGESGQTCREIWEGYRTHRQQVDTAIQEVKAQ